MNNIHRKTTYCKKLVACLVSKPLEIGLLISMQGMVGTIVVDAHYIEVRFLIIPPCKTGLRGSIVED